MSEPTTYKPLMEVKIAEVYSITFDERVDNFVFHVGDFTNYFKKKQDLQITAIRNLIKTKRLLQLDIQLSQELITESEYEQELSRESEKYVIHIADKVEDVDVFLVNEIVKEASLEAEITLDEAADIFSLDYNQLMTSHGSDLLQIG